MKKANKNKVKYIVFWCIGLACTAIPVLVFNIIKYKMFEAVSGVRLTFSAMLALGMVGVAILSKLKFKGAWYTILAGSLIAILGEMAIQIGWSMMMIGGGMVLDRLLWSRIAIMYKERWYNETGRQVTYTRNVAE